MSTENVRKILLRIQSDEAFFSEMRANPENALEGYTLTEDEKNALLTGDKRLAEYLLPSATDPESKFQFVITITMMHDWLNMANVRPIESLSPESKKQLQEMANAALEAGHADKVSQLIDILQILDNRTQK